MKIKDIIIESGMQTGAIDPGNSNALSNTFTMPDQNMYHGSGYKHSQFVKALAGAGGGSVPSINMGDENWAAGNPVVSAYHPIEEEMIDNAAKHIGDNSKTLIGSNKKSQEGEDVHKISPHRNPGPVARKR